MTSTAVLARRASAVAHRSLDRNMFASETPLSVTQIMDVMKAIIDKLREGLPAWDELISIGGAEKLLEAAFRVDTGTLSIEDNLQYIVFMIHVFQSLEIPLIRTLAFKMVHLALWANLTPTRLQLELLRNAEVASSWKKLKKMIDKKGDDFMKLPRTFLPNFLKTFYDILGSIHQGSPDPFHITYCERFCEFINDLLCQFPTRRFFKAFVEDRHVYAECVFSQLYQMPEGRMFRDLLGIMKFYLGFEIDDISGNALDNNAIKQRQTRKLIAFQRVCWKFFREKLQELALCNLGMLEARKALRPYLEKLPLEILQGLCHKLALIDPTQASEETRGEYFLELLLFHHEKRMSQLDDINALPLFPNESILWDFNMVPRETYGFDAPLSLPKLNLQFLTFHDYLLRNFNLFRLESTYEVREDIEDALIRMQPRTDLEGRLYYKSLGKSRMSIPIEDFTIRYVGPPDIGQTKPHEVRAQITIDLTILREHFRAEWNELRQHDVLLLVSLEAPKETMSALAGQTAMWFFDRKKPFLDQYKVTCVRGCEVVDVRDEKENVFTGLGDSGVRLTGTKRVLRVLLDTAQYHTDVAASQSDCYTKFQILLRRKPKENNFKAVLDSIRELMNTQCVVPEWLHDIFLGYGDPDAAFYKNMPDQLTTINFVDSLLDVEHAKSVFQAEYAVEIKAPEQPLFLTESSTAEDPSAALKRPFLITFPTKDEEQEVKAKNMKPVIAVTSYLPPNEGPYPQDQPKLNQVRFTSVQVEALRASSNPGLTLVVGPPGTGKTDVAVQIVSNIYHNFPNSRTLIVTHSNNALNDIFEKISLKDVDERYLLRLGAGGKDLKTEMSSHKDFTKHGRVEFMLARRLIQLKEVRKIADALGVGETLGDVDYTCETASHFYKHEMLARWEKFLQQRAAAESEGKCDNNFIKENFPFHPVFADLCAAGGDAPFDFNREFRYNWYAAEGCWRHIQKIFEEIEDCRAFELFKTANDRGNYLLCRQAKIIAMTCTFAALKRKELVRLKFEYDNIVMEEAAQILEIETFIPMLLQNPTSEGGCRLKRVVLIGDHNQLPPVVKNMAFQKFSHMDQSLFTRLVRLGVPTIMLNAQGRMRSSLADLYRWRYKDLTDLAHVSTDTIFKRANTGFCYEYQCVNVPYYNGQGETEPEPHFFQNLGEAEYVVGVYMYMRLIGYPAEKITILTTYNGQKFLIRDILNFRCGESTIFGKPSSVTTVDKFQGRQNDYILLSLVRTQNIGHIRDVRRMIVAMSRARLGLYVFCKADHFQEVWELKPFFNILLKENRPTVLALNLNELKYPLSDRVVGETGEAFLVEGGVTELGGMVEEMVRARIQLETEKYDTQAAAWKQFATDEKTRQEDEAKRQAELEHQRYVARRERELKRVKAVEGGGEGRKRGKKRAGGNASEGEEDSGDEASAMKKARLDT